MLLSPARDLAPELETPSDHVPRTAHHEPGYVCFTQS